MDIGYTSALYGTFQQSNNRMSYDNNVFPDKIVQVFFPIATHFFLSILYTVLHMQVLFIKCCLRKKSLILITLM